MTNKKRFLAFLLVFVLIFSLGACSLLSKNLGKDESDADAGTDVEAVDDDTDSETDASDNAEETEDSGSVQSLDKFPTFDEWTPVLPEYQDFLSWTAIPIDYIGGMGTWVEPKSDNDGYVNVRDAPTLDSEVVGEVHRDMEIFWWVVQEYNVQDDQIWIGEYIVPYDDYTWTLVSYEESETGGPTLGWVALEVVQLIAV